MQPRIPSLASFRSTHGSSPLLDVIGFAPESVLAWVSSQFIEILREVDKQRDLCFTTANQKLQSEVLGIPSSHGQSKEKPWRDSSFRFVSNISTSRGILLIKFWKQGYANANRWDHSSTTCLRLSFSSTNSSVKGICFKFCFARSLKTNDRGIYPDYMHIVHLALGVDCMSSVLLDLTDDGMNLIAGTNRDQRLKHVWDSYREWCEGTSGFGCIFF